MALLLPTKDDLVWWRASLRALAPFEDDELAPARAALQVRTLARGEVYLSAGARASRVGLVRIGVLREFYPMGDARERTRAFGVSGDFAGSLSDLLNGGPSRTEVVAVRASRVLELPWALVVELTQSGAWHALLDRVVTRLYLAKSEREYELLGLDALARYDRFRERFPTLERHVAQRHVASYLGITPEHLSRLRRRSGLSKARRRSGT